MPLCSRDKFLTGPAPDSGSSKPFSAGWLHDPKKSGTAGGAAAACALTGVTAIVRTIRRSRLCDFITLSSFVIYACVRSYFGKPPFAKYRSIADRRQLRICGRLTKPVTKGGKLPRRAQMENVLCRATRLDGGK